jgi:hypothetical protein
MNDEQIKRAATEVLSELNLNERRFEIEPAMGAAIGESTRQIRLFDSDGNDRAVVVDFQDKNGEIGNNFEEIKEKIRKQLQPLVELGE